MEVFFFIEAPLSRSLSIYLSLSLSRARALSLPLSLCIYIYIYIYVCVCVCVYIYTATQEHSLANQMEREGGRKSAGAIIDQKRGNNGSQPVDFTRSHRQLKQTVVSVARPTKSSA